MTPGDKHSWAVGVLKCRTKIWALYEWLRSVCPDLNQFKLEEENPREEHPKGVRVTKFYHRNMYSNPSALVWLEFIRPRNINDKQIRRILKVVHGYFGCLIRYRFEARYCHFFVKSPIISRSRKKEMVPRLKKEIFDSKISSPIRTASLMWAWKIMSENSIIDNTWPIVVFKPFEFIFCSSWEKRGAS